MQSKLLLLLSSFALANNYHWGQIITTLFGLRPGEPMGE
jgi:hypothetical protein